MPLLILTWNLPPQSAFLAYANDARSKWIPSVLAQPGLEEIRAFRNGSETKPDVMVTVEFATIPALEEYMSSRQYPVVISGLRSVGCTEITAQVWNSSPLLPSRIRPGDAGALATTGSSEESTRPQ